jgi:hypothetical protein
LIGLRVLVVEETGDGNDLGAAEDHGQGRSGPDKSAGVFVGVKTALPINDFSYGALGQVEELVSYHDAPSLMRPQ